VAVVVDHIIWCQEQHYMQVVLVALELSFSSIQKKFHLAIQQTLGSLELQELGLRQQEFPMLTT
jgi:hypothetical protein